MRLRKKVADRRAGWIVCSALIALAFVFALTALAQNAPFDPKAQRANDGLTLLQRADRYSLDNSVVVIAIAKGRKDDMSGEKIGDTLANIFKTQFDIPTKYFVEPGGDYTSVAYFVKGLAHGPYGLKDSIGMTSIAASDYEERALGHE